MPSIPIEFVSPEGSPPGERILDYMDLSLQYMHPGTSARDGDTASGRT